MKRLIALLMGIVMASAMGLTAFATINEELLDKLLQRRFQEERDTALSEIYDGDLKDLVTVSSKTTTNYAAIEKWLTQYTKKQLAEVIREGDAAEIARRNASPEQDKLDLYGHNYVWDHAVKHDYNDPKAGIRYTTLETFYVCTKCGDTYSEIQ